VQNGVLKALSFIFEYIGPTVRDYVWAAVPVLEDALMDRDVVHRQTACFAVKHIALGLQGCGHERALRHLLNYVLPNLFEPRPHLMMAVFDAIEALRVSLGPHVLLAYCVAGLFHAARRVRIHYWRIFNNLVVYAADALVPALPAFPDDLADVPVALLRRYGLREDAEAGLSDWNEARTSARFGSQLWGPAALRPAQPADAVAVTNSAAPPPSFLALARAQAKAADAAGQIAKAAEMDRVVGVLAQEGAGPRVRRVRNRYTQTYSQLIF
jgi:hypothetical protein